MRLLKNFNSLERLNSLFIHLLPKLIPPLLHVFIVLLNILLLICHLTFLFVLLFYFVSDLQTYYPTLFLSRFYIFIHLVFILPNLFLNFNFKFFHNIFRQFKMSLTYLPFFQFISAFLLVAHSLIVFFIPIFAFTFLVTIL